MLATESFIEHFHFLRPAWLIILLPLLVLFIYMLKHKLSSKSWDAICDQNLLPYLLIGQTGGKRYASVLLLAIAGLLAILALAGPTWQQIPQPVFKEQTALIIALDLSRSMDATDIKPSRLTRARFKVADILNLRQEGQTALLVYAGDTYVVTPLTSDTQTINSQLAALTTDIMPVQGNNTVAALEKASELLKQAGLTSGSVLLITDEIDYERSKDAVIELTAQGYRLSVLGVGTTEGEPIPLASGGFLKNRQGAIVIPSYDDREPRQLVQQGQGVYRAMTSDDTDVKAIIDSVKTIPATDDAETSQFQSDIWQEQGPWLLLLLIPLAALAFRRGYLFVFIIILIPMPEPVYALDWQDLWLRSDQQAQRALQQGDTSEAANLFSDPAWKAVAQYQAGDFSTAVETLETVEDAEGLYNKANALARTGQYEAAIAAYDRALELMPGHEDAQYNRDLIEQTLKEQQQKQQQQEKSEQDQQDPDSQEKQESNEQQNQTRGEQQQEQTGQNPEQQSEQQQSQESQKNNEQQQNTQQQKLEKEQEEQDAANEEKVEGQPDEQLDKQENEQAKAQEKQQMQAQEQTQATEQWLRRIPDDPSSLLKRKFLYQYQQRDGRQVEERQSW